MASLLTGNAAKSLGHDQRFPREPLPAFAYESIDYERADAIAAAYVNTFGSIAVADWSRHHRGPIDLSKLNKCGRTLFARSAYEGVDEQLDPSLRNFVAGQFIVYYCGASGDPQVVISVSSVEVGFQFTVDGRLRYPQSGAANAVFSQGVTPIAGGFPVPSPERAAAIAALATGRRVAEQPVLTMPPFPKPASFARWSIVLDSPVEVRVERDAERRPIDIVYVGQEIGIVRPVGALAESRAADREVDEISFGGAGQSVRLRRSRGVPAQLSSIHVNARED